MDERSAERMAGASARAGGGKKYDADTPGTVDVPRADCVLCGEPTEYPETTRGATLCPVCEWQEGQRLACSG